MQRDRKNVISGLKSKGFIPHDTHHKYFVFKTLSGKKTAINTRVSHGTQYKTLGDPLLNAMSKQCQLSKKDFLNLVDCPLSREDYENMMIEKDAI